MRRVTLFLLLAVASPGTTAHAEPAMVPDERALSAFSDDPARRFDFWIGAWTVNLRMLQEDGTFRDSVAATPHIYSILDGKAILELWDSEPIKGYSLRYYDPAKGKWVLWLSWPRNNRSSVSSLEGGFRHGRGDFYSTNTNAAGQENVQHYSFNDITPFSLRWDDLHSKDGGRTWAKNWIMEWTRVAVDPRWPIPDDAVPTFVDGSRCDDEAFRSYEAIVGHWQGDGARLDAYRILDGCAVMAFLDAGERNEFLFLTFLSDQQRWETGVLDQRPETGLVRYQSTGDWTRPTTAEGESLSWSVKGERLIYARDDVVVRLNR